MVNPIPRILFLTILTILSIPLIFLALITTSVAVLTLTLRALSVYIDLGLALVGSLFSASRSPATTSQPRALPQSKHSGAPSPTLTSYQRALRHRRTSSSSGHSGGSQTPSPKRASSGIFGLGALGSTRDFEGVGGWRFTTPADEEHDEEMWMGLNSRLELPAAVPNGGMVNNGEKGPKKKRHRRVLTEGNPPIRLEHRQAGESSPEEDLGMAPHVRGERTPEELTMEGGVGETFFGGGKKPATTGEDFRALIVRLPSGSPTSTVSSSQFNRKNSFAAARSIES
jgi:hypothetical protein